MWLSSNLPSIWEGLERAAVRVGDRAMGKHPA